MLDYFVKVLAVLFLPKLLELNKNIGDFLCALCQDVLAYLICLGGGGSF